MKCPECGKPVTTSARVDRRIPRSLSMSDTAARREVIVSWHPECRAHAEAEVRRIRAEYEAERDTMIAAMLADTGQAGA